MMMYTPARLKAVVVGCALAALSCFATPQSYLERAEPHCTFYRCTFNRCTFRLNETLGAWDRLEQRELQPSELRVLQARDHWQCVYQHRETKQIVVVTLIAAEGGALTSHVPETCYARKDYCSLSEAIVWNVPDRSDTFRFQTLAPRMIDQPAVTIGYAWDDGRRWTAPQYPRFQLAGHATLQRLLITMRHPNGMGADARQAMQQFLELTVNASGVPQGIGVAKLTSEPNSY